jgi:hypothetical protein
MRTAAATTLTVEAETIRAKVNAPAVSSRHWPIQTHLSMIEGTMSEMRGGEAEQQLLKLSINL